MTGASTWLSRYRRRHLQLMVPLTLALAIGLTTFPPLPAETQLVALVVAVALLGLPHGALDHLSGRRLVKPLAGIGWFPLFAAGYLLLAALVFVLWGFAPRFMLTAFLVYSAFHFGAGDAEATAGDRRPNWILAPARGALPLALPALFHSDEVTRYFNWLLPAEEALTAPVVEAAAGKVALAALLTLVAAVGLSIAEEPGARGSVVRAGEILELATLALLFALAPPLVAFLIYFCGWHSVRHLFELGAELSPRDPREAARRLVASSWPLTLATLIGGFFVWKWLATSGLGAEVALGRVLFIGLAALTVPHMLLGSLVAWHEARLKASDERIEVKEPGPTGEVRLGNRPARSA